MMHYIMRRSLSLQTLLGLGEVAISVIVWAVFVLAGLISEVASAY